MDIVPRAGVVRAMALWLGSRVAPPSAADDAPSGAADTESRVAAKVMHVAEICSTADRERDPPLCGKEAEEAEVPFLPLDQCGEISQLSRPSPITTSHLSDHCSFTLTAHRRLSFNTPASWQGKRTCRPGSAV